MPDIFQYTDYRLFLKDYYLEEKARLQKFSFENFARKAGVDRSFIHNIMHGRKNVAPSNIFRIASAMGLSKKQIEYFENLVLFNQSQNLDESRHFFERLSSIKGTIAPRKIKENQYELYSKYYHSVIRSLIDMYGFKDNYRELAKMVYPRVSPMQAKRSVQLLERLELIKKQKDGRYVITDKYIATPDEVKSLAVRNLHIETGKLGLSAVSELPKEVRNFTGMTLGISRKSYELVCEEINDFHDKVAKIASDDKDADMVYRLNFQFFPVSELKKAIWAAREQEKKQKEQEKEQEKEREQEEE